MSDRVLCSCGLLAATDYEPRALYHREKLLASFVPVEGGNCGGGDVVYVSGSDTNDPRPNCSNTGRASKSIVRLCTTHAQADDRSLTLSHRWRSGHGHPFRPLAEGILFFLLPSPTGGRAGLWPRYGTRAHGAHGRRLNAESVDFWSLTAVADMDYLAIFD